jgi:hypothetical protein
MQSGGPPLLPLRTQKKACHPEGLEPEPARGSRLRDPPGKQNFLRNIKQNFNIQNSLILVRKSILPSPRRSLIRQPLKYQLRTNEYMVVGFGMTRSVGQERGEEAAGRSSVSLIIDAVRISAARRFFPSVPKKKRVIPKEWNPSLRGVHD